MATIYRYSDSTAGGSQEVFKGGIQVLTAVKIPFLDALLAPSSLAIVTEVSMQNSETIQFFMTFDDVISWFYFGKGMGQMSVRGLLLTNEEGTPGLPVLLQDVMKVTRGKAVQVSMGNAVFRCVMTGFNLNMSQDPSPVVEFTLNLSIVGHNLPTREKQNVPCDYNPRFDDVI
jgi:hypothetical protein